MVNGRGRGRGRDRVAALTLGVVALVGGGASAAYGVLEGEERDTAEQRYAETRLLFGTARPDGGPAVTEAEFRAFVDGVVTPRFPDGLTVQEGYGQWRDAQGVIEEERSYEVILYYPAGEAASDREIEEVREAYVRRFGQEAVARVDDVVGVDF
jgi:hypothetical protein